MTVLPYTVLRLACHFTALMVIFAQLPKCYLMRKNDQATTGALPKNQLACAHSGRLQITEFYTTWKQRHSVMGPQTVAVRSTTGLESCMKDQAVTVMLIYERSGKNVSSSRVH